MFIHCLIAFPQLRVDQGLTKVAPVAPDEPEEEVEVDADVADDAAQGTEGLSDMDWLRRHMSKNVDKDEPAFEQSDDEDEKMADQVCRLPLILKGAPAQRRPMSGRPPSTAYTQ